MEQEVMNQHYRTCGSMNACGEHALEIRKPEASHKPQKWNKAVLPLHPHGRAGVIICFTEFPLFMTIPFHPRGRPPSSLVVSR